MATLKLAVFCTSLVGSCLTSSRDVIAACARASLNQLRAPPWNVDAWPIVHVRRQEEACNFALHIYMQWTKFVVDNTLLRIGFLWRHDWVKNFNLGLDYGRRCLNEWRDAVLRPGQFLLRRLPAQLSVSARAAYSTL